VNGSQTTEQYCYHIKHALKKAAGLASLGWESPARDALEAALAKLDKPGEKSDANVASLLRQALKRLEELERDGELSKKFNDALQYLCSRAGITVTELARNIDEPDNMLRSWAAGDSAPDRFCGYPVVQKIEIYFGCKPKLLWLKVLFGRPGGGTIPAKYWPTEIPLDVRIRKEVRARLPEDILARSEEERRAEFLRVYERVKKILAKGINANRRRQIADRYRHNPKSWSQDLQLEVADYFQAGDVQIDETLDEWPAPSLSEGTQDNILHSLYSLFGYASSRRKRGPNIPVGNLSMAWFAVPELPNESAMFSVGRRPKKNEKSHVLPKELALLFFGRQQVSSKGWVRHRPDLAAKLVPVEGLLTEDDCREARNDWRRWCDRAYTKYQGYILQLRPLVAKRGTGGANNPKTKAASILKGDVLGFLEHFSRRLSETAARYDPHKVGGAFAIRDFLMGSFKAKLYLRSRTDRNVTWRRDNTGHLRKIGNKYFLLVPRKWFKNRDGVVFADEEEVLFEINDTDGLYAALDLYLAPGGARSLLLDGKESDLLFVKKSAKVESDAKDHWRAVQALTGRFFAGEEGKPWEDVLAINPHLFRQLGYTGIRKATGDSKKAANALLITEDVGEESYNWQPPSERVKDTKEVQEKHRRSG
jgi:hypothetical protein